MFFIDVKLRDIKKVASYLIDGTQYDSFLGEDGTEYIRLMQRYVDHGFKRARWETPYIRVPSRAIKLREKTQQ